MHEHSLRSGFAGPPGQAGPRVYWMFFDNAMTRREAFGAGIKCHIDPVFGQEVADGKFCGSSPYPTG